MTLKHWKITFRKGTRQVPTKLDYETKRQKVGQNLKDIVNWCMAALGIRHFFPVHFHFPVQQFIFPAAQPSCSHKHCQSCKTLFIGAFCCGNLSNYITISQLCCSNNGFIMAVVITLLRASGMLLLLY